MMDLDQFRKIYSDYRLAEARTKAAKYSAWDNNSQRFNIQPPQEKQELYTRKVDLVRRIPEVVRSVVSSNPLKSGITSKLAGVDKRDDSEKFLSYGELFNFEELPSDMVDVIKQALEPLKIGIFIEGKKSIEQTQRTPEFTTTIATYNLVKSIIAAFVAMRDSVMIDDRKQLRDATNSITNVSNTITVGSIPEKVVEVLKSVADMVELTLSSKLKEPLPENSSSDAVPTGGAEPQASTETTEDVPKARDPVAEIAQNNTNAAADLHDQNDTNMKNSTKASQVLIPLNQREMGSIERVEKGDIIEAQTALNYLMSKFTEKPEEDTTMGEDEVETSKPASSTSSDFGLLNSGMRINPVDGKVIASESNVLAQKNESEKALEALRKALTEAKFNPDDPKSKASWRPPGNWTYDAVNKTWSFATTAASAPTIVRPTEELPTTVATNTSANQGTVSRSRDTGDVPASAVPPSVSRTGLPNMPISTPQGNTVLPQANAVPAIPLPQTTAPRPPTNPGSIALSVPEQNTLISWMPTLTYGQLMNADEATITTAVTGGVVNASQITYIKKLTDRVNFAMKAKEYLLTYGKTAYDLLTSNNWKFKKEADGINRQSKEGKQLGEALTLVLIPAEPQGPPPDLPAPAGGPDAAVQLGGEQGAEGSEGNGKPKKGGVKRKLVQIQSNLQQLDGKEGKPRKKKLDILSGSGFIPVVFGGNNTETTDKNLAEFGGEVIYDMKILRSPLPKHMDEALDLITGNDFSKLKQKYHFDQIFHLAVMVTTPKGPLLIEKNAHGINVAKYIQYPSEELSIASRRFGKPDFTVGSLILNTQKAMGDKFYTYSAFGNNCQNFIFNLLRSNGLMTLEYANFVSQDMTELLKELNSTNPQAVPVINAVTGALGIKQRYEDYIKNNPNPNVEP
jgi:hypothetical protein